MKPKKRAEKDNKKSLKRIKRYVKGIASGSTEAYDEKLRRKAKVKDLSKLKNKR
jgi:hypothetical protein